MEPRERTMNLTGGTLFINDPETGAAIEVGNVEMGEVKFNDNATATGVIKPVKIGEMTSLSFECKLLPHRMSRKRFIKKLMSMRIQRNVAYVVAEWCNAVRMPYHAYYIQLKLIGC